MEEDHQWNEAAPLVSFVVVCHILNPTRKNVANIVLLKKRYRVQLSLLLHMLSIDLIFIIEPTVVV